MHGKYYKKNFFILNFLPNSIFSILKYAVLKCVCYKDDSVDLFSEKETTYSLAVQWSSVVEPHLTYIRVLGSIPREETWGEEGGRTGKDKPKALLLIK